MGLWWELLEEIISATTIIRTITTLIRSIIFRMVPRILLKLITMMTMIMRYQQLLTWLFSVTEILLVINADIL